MLEWDAIFFAVVKNKVARQLDLAVFVKFCVVKVFVMIVRW